MQLVMEHPSHAWMSILIYLLRGSVKAVSSIQITFICVLYRFHVLIEVDTSPL